MLQSLDTLIAFVVIMAIVSLFVTILVQMVSAALSLRGKNLANALALTFQTIDPNLSKGAHQLAAKILTDPLLSDSTQTNKDRAAHVVPMNMAPWSALTLSRDHAVKLATSIRPEEVYGALKKLAAGFDGKSEATLTAEAKVASAQNALSALSPTDDLTAASNALAAAQDELANCQKADSDKFDADLATKRETVEAAEKKVAEAAEDQKKAAQDELTVAQKELDDFYATSLPGNARKLLAGLGVPADKSNAVADKLSAFRQVAGLLPSDLKGQFDKALQDTSAQLVHLIDTEQERFERWFNRAQDRAQQWFQLHTRVVTICASISIALLFQLDAVEVFHFVGTNSPARAALVASADKIVHEGGDILDEKGGLIKRINDAWVGKPDKLTDAQLEGVVDSGQLQQKLSAQLPNGTPFDTAAFDKVVRKATEDYYRDQSNKIGKLTSGLSATGFELIPNGFWRWPTDVPAKSDKCRSWYFFWSYWRHGLGMLLFAGLLTLGAPYWYNLLKNLTSLRPALAQIIGGEDAAGTAQAPAGK